MWSLERPPWAGARPLTNRFCALCGSNEDRTPAAGRGGQSPVKIWSEPCHHVLHSVPAQALHLMLALLRLVGLQGGSHSHQSRDVQSQPTDFRHPHSFSLGGCCSWNPKCSVHRPLPPWNAWPKLAEPEAGGPGAPSAIAPWGAGPPIRHWPRCPGAPKAASSPLGSAEGRSWGSQALGQLRLYHMGRAGDTLPTFG